MPERPTPADIELLAFAQQVELTARDLYQAALAGGAGGEDDGVFPTLRDNHLAAANLISGILGSAAPQQRDNALYEQLVGEFEAGERATVATAAYDLESTTVSTHLELLGQLEGIDSATTIASILIIESRACAVLADVGGGGDDFAALFDNDAAALAPSASAG